MTIDQYDRARELTSQIRHLESLIKTLSFGFNNNEKSTKITACTRAQDGGWTDGTWDILRDSDIEIISEALKREIEILKVEFEHL